MFKEFNIVYDKKTGTWEEKKEPYITIEVETEEDYKVLLEWLEKQKAKKPLGVDLHRKESGNIHLWVCPICQIFLLGRRMADEKPSLHPNYCPWCGQKIDWNEVTE